ncbi:MAG: DUF819 family protein [Candidatus Krumholzibacteriota bacterium]|nr:DUF819 family protein [Candidatus Krumholzibacteriota bacterium]
MISSNAGVLAMLLGVCAFWFYLEKASRWKIFDYLPPLIFIYATPVLLTNTGVIATDSAVYGSIRQILLPMMLVLLLLKVDVGAAFRVMGKGVFVMLSGTLGVMVGAPIAFLLVKHGLGPEGWKAFGTLAGSWIGGTGQMAAVTDMIDTPGFEFGLAVIADNSVYVVWLPILLASRNFAKRFARFARVSEDRLEMMEKAARDAVHEESTPRFTDYLYLLFIAAAVTWISIELGNRLPTSDVISASTWKILLVSTIGVGLSFTPLRRIAGSHELAMAFVYLFVARMGASAHFEGEGAAGQIMWFLIGSFIWIFIHGAFCLAAARIFRVDVHTAAIASAANIGGAASAPIVASYHNESLVPASILLALIGYAIGTHAAWITALVCRALA